MKSKVYQFIGVVSFLILFIFSYLFYAGKIFSITAINDAAIEKEEAGFAVFELFASESCGKCPAAEVLLAKIQTENVNKALYILTYHVDYWDIRGWKDQFGQAIFSDRQRQYARWLNSTVYTPQLVVNGSKEFIGSDEQAVNSVIRDEFSRKNPSSLQLTSDYVKNGIRVRYQGVQLLEHEEVVVALIEKEGQTQVKAGPNSGKLLSHIQIVHQLVKLDNIVKEQFIPIPTTWNTKEWELIGFVQSRNNGRIRDAARHQFAWE
ncbi:thioredoxin family protein [Flavobacterium sp. HSC-61S13]|uniref:DUF1223 domain-containing protein n=1 Tax=Flavobacterium sp. HSC-61S13 TaxID=2910963 RepID=UPI0020A09B59|nr:DUF1223 domain-containing protein [Flavobacterium sp. HSC-61S13]MCP1996793.1 hypothetical protein [Flavobacterium sp. HSC-61S13]